MKLLKTTFFTSLTTLIKIGTSFLANKVVAVIIGPVGIGLMGQFTNFLTLIYNFGNGAINSGVVKYTAEFDGDDNLLKNLFSTSLKITIYFSLSIGFLICIFSNSLSKLLFNTNEYQNPIILLSVTLLLYSLNSLLISIVNGKKKIKIFTLMNTLTSIFGLIVTIILVYYFKILGAIYSLVISQSFVFVFNIMFVIKSRWCKWSLLLIPINKNLKNKLFGFSLMSITSSIVLPISQIIIRTLLLNRFGENAAGYWQASMRISDGYLLLITTSLSTYYLPKLSSIHNNNTELKKEIYNGYKIIIPFIIITSFFIYFFRLEVIQILFSNQFNLVSELLGWQLIGDFFKISSWILAFLMLAKAMTKIFIITEIIFSISLIVLTYFITYFFGLKGVSIAFAINYFIYLVTMLILFRDILFKNIK